MDSEGIALLHFPFAHELIGELEKAVISQDEIIVNTALATALNLG